MAHGGIETWLMHCLRHGDRERVTMDFLVHTDDAAAYDGEIRELGGRIIPCLGAHQPTIYARNFRACLSDFGPYDIVHSHLHHFSGYALRLARRAGVPVRIAHSHNDISATTAGTWRRRAYMTLMSRWIRNHATHGLACSRRAATALYGADWEHDSRWQVLLYGIDLGPFQEPVDGAALRAELGIPADAFVIGHVGRFADQKNHRFLLEVIAEVRRRAPDTHLLLVGDGPLRPGMQRYAADLGLAGQVSFAGLRNDVPQLMRGVMDHFLFPSNFEGLGLVLIEAQAAGLPCLFSTVVPQEVDVVPHLLSRLDLSESADRWATECLRQRDHCLSASAGEAMEKIVGSPFNIEAAVKQLETLYQNFVAQTESRRQGSL